MVWHEGDHDPSSHFLSFSVPVWWSRVHGGSLSGRFLSEEVARRVFSGAWRGAEPDSGLFLTSPQSKPFLYFTCDLPPSGSSLDLTHTAHSFRGPAFVLAPGCQLVSF